MADWKNVALLSTATMADAIKCIDASALQVALVVNEDQRLAGVITDGDVRRGLLRGLDLKASVVEIMSAQPHTARIGTAREELLAELRRLSIRHLPLVDAENRLAGLVTERELTGPARSDNWVVLMAGGLGSRLAPLTNTVPKPMLPLGDKPLLQTILEKFIEDGFHRFYISVNYLAEQVIAHFGDGSAWGVEIRYLHETQRLGTAGALSLIPVAPEAPIIVMNGDLLTKVNFQHLIAFHEQNGSAATMGVREYDFQVPYGVVSTEGGRITAIEEKPIHRFYVNAGIYVVSPHALAMIPSGSFFDMPTLFTTLIERAEPTSVFPIREYWLDVGQIADYRRAQAEYAEIFS